MFPRIVNRQFSLRRPQEWRTRSLFVQSRVVGAPSVVVVVAPRFPLSRISALHDEGRRSICHATRPVYFSQAYDGVPDNVAALINHHAKVPQTSVSLQALMRTGRGEYLHKTFEDMENVDKHSATNLVLIQVASFLRRELPIRLAHRIQDLEGIPLMRDMSSCKDVKELYVKSFLELVEFDEKITNSEQEAAFSRLVENIYERHSRVLVQMARAAYEFRKQVAKGAGDSKDVFAKMEETHQFLDRFYLCRIGIRVLIGQYLALRQPPVENYVGIICSVTSPYEIVKRAIDDAAFMCTRKYGDAPEVIMSGRLDLTFPYVPTHLRKLFPVRNFVIYFFNHIHIN